MASSAATTLSVGVGYGEQVTLFLTNLLEQKAKPDRKIRRGRGDRLFLRLCDDGYHMAAEQIYHVLDQTI